MKTLLRTPKLLPLPRKVEWGDGFLEWSKAEFNVDENGLPCSDFLSIEKSEKTLPHNAYQLSISEDGITIRVSDESGARIALATLRQIGMTADERGFRFCEIEDSPNFETRTFALDLSRGKVPTLEHLKLLVDTLSLFKYNRLELCLTNAFPFEGRELEWASQAVMPVSRISKLKSYCSTQGIELAFAFDVSRFENGAELALKIAKNFDCRDINIGGRNADTKTLQKAINTILDAGFNPIYFADSFAKDLENLPQGTPIFTENFANAYKFAKEKGIDFIVSANANLSKFSNYDAARKEIISTLNLGKENGASGFHVEFSAGTFCPFCTIFPPALLAASSAWNEIPTDEAVCEALDAFVFYDTTGNFSRAIIALGRVIESDFLFDAFFANKDSIEKLLKYKTDIDFDVLESSADFALALAATSKPESRDFRILSAEVALTGAMMKYAVNKARGNSNSIEQNIALKFIVADFENVWLARNENGGLWEASKILREL